LLKRSKYNNEWHKKICQNHISKKYEIYGYTSLDKLAEWNKLIPKQKCDSFTCKKEYQYIDLFKGK
jgi:hypothetical protein